MRANRDSSYSYKHLGLRLALYLNPPGTETFTVNGVTFTMVTVEGGTFTMGATAEQGSDAGGEEYPTHQVTLSSYSIGQTEVTQELWQAVMGSNPSCSQGNLQHPVEQVSWEDCQTFVAELNELTGKTFRLPTEAEWEYAARGGNKSLGYKYAGSNDINEVAWYWDGTSTTIQPVATKAPNELGIYDMSGNVYEWCQDSWGSYTSGAQTNPTGPTSGSLRVDRGGSYGHDGGRCRVSHRNYYHQTLKDGKLGLRLAL
ncbi:MAG: SUMF1/EgtB/PvdO family nonheme iron enzyme [Muribaculaceae bacterium]|nr:SUMF1/EgtB/PvdO family nonheme iron enzyme [Muribaculaceae bacterium]